MASERQLGPLDRPLAIQGTPRRGDLIAGYSASLNAPALFDLYADVQDVREYDIDMTGNNDSSGGFAKLCAEVPSSGSNIILPRGTMLTQGGHSITSGPFTLIGQGWGMRSNTAGNDYNGGHTWLKSSGNNVPFLTYSANNCRFADFRLSCTAPAPGSSNAGILCSGGGQLCAYDRLGIDGFWINLDHQAGHYWALRDSMLGHPWYTNLRIQDIYAFDEGDMYIHNNWFLGGLYAQYATIVAGVVWLCGGGLKVIGNKFNSGALATAGGGDYTILPVDVLLLPQRASVSATEGSGELTFVANSFGAYEQAGVRLDFTGLTNKSVAKIILVGNNGLGVNGGAQLTYNSPKGIYGGKFLFHSISNGSSNSIQNMEIDGNVLTYSALAHLESVFHASIGRNNVGNGSPGTADIEISSWTVNAKPTPQAHSEIPFKLAESSTNLYNYKKAAPEIYINQAQSARQNDFTAIAILRDGYGAADYATSVSISAINFNGSTLLEVTTSQAHNMTAGADYYIRGIVSSHAAGGTFLDTLLNGKVHTCLAVNGTTKFLIALPGTTAPTDTYTSGGQVTSEGAVFEILAKPGASFSLELVVNLLGTASSTNDGAISAKVCREVNVQSLAAGASIMPVLMVSGADAGMVDPPGATGQGAVYEVAGDAPAVANTQVLGGGATVQTANSTINNPCFMSTNDLTGVGLEIAFEAVKTTGNYPGTYACLTAPAVSSCARGSVVINSTTYYWLSVTFATQHGLNVGMQCTLAGFGAADGLRPVWWDSNNNTVYFLTGTTDPGASPTNGTMDRDRYVVSVANSYNPGTGTNGLKRYFSPGQIIDNRTVANDWRTSAAWAPSTGTNPRAGWARLTLTNHTLTNHGALITTSGFTPSAYNVTDQPVNVIDANTIEFPISGSPGDASVVGTYSIKCPRRRVMQVLNEHAVHLDGPMPVNYFQLSHASSNYVNAVKLKIYTRLMGNLGQMQGQAALTLKGVFCNLTKIAA